MKPTNLAFLTTSVLLSMCFTTSALADVDYYIDINQPAHHLAQVSVSFPKTESTQLTVNLPVWRTGRYQVLPVADGVRLFEATDSKGKVLPWQRTASGEWTISLTQPTAVKVTYQLHANELADRLRHIDESHAYLDASGVLMYSPEFRQEPVTVDMKVPKGWKSFSGMEKGRGSHSFKAANYDVLADSPIETGINQDFSFEADGREYEVVFWGEGNYDTEQILTDLRKISGQASMIWDDYPFERYVYMVHATSGARGATEHLNSTVIQLPRFNFREREDYLRFISTASHEFIHTWNVKSYRPQGLVPYDYQSENMSDLLWVAEGSTSYFQNQLLLRAGVITAKEFFDDLSLRIVLNEHNPGRDTQSVAEASLGQWSSTWGDYAINHSVNIYSEGYLASMALDFSVIQDSELAHSYRDVHKALYQDFKIPMGYNVADVQNILTTLTGKDYQPWWQKFVNQPFSLEFDTLLAQAGLVTTYGDKPKTQVDTGIGLSGLHGDLVLATVAKNSPAWKAGLTAGDELLAVNDLKVTADAFAKRFDDFKPGDKVKLTVFSNDRLKEVSMVLGEQPKGELSIQALESVTTEQKAFFKAWLGIDWPFDADGEYKTDDEA
ncbi:M61 family metallopeptidase [Shewanella litoralis]|uniref:Peptidase M61 n=1 Tax=Shewanella litoralis TaxID=2282700 RepID=A0ABQ2RE51_9GAMM|nr:peptidase M61 [Shewanella litoralis]